MTRFRRILRVALYLASFLFIIFSVPKLYDLYSGLLQRQEIFQDVKKAATHASNKAAPKNWQSLNNWWLIGQDGTLVYNDNNLNKSQQDLVQTAADWWNQMAGRQIIVKQSDTNEKADVYLAYVDNKYLNFSGLTATNHVMLFNRADVSNSGNQNDTLNVFIHEFGHGLGLAHAPQSYNDVMSPSQEVTGQAQVPSTYDKQALKASLKRMSYALNRDMSEDNYMAVAGQTPYPDDLNRLSDPVFNSRDALAATIKASLDKIGNTEDMTAIQQQLVSNTKSSMNTIENNPDVTDSQIEKAQRNLEKLVQAFKLEKYYPTAFPNDQSNLNTDDLNNFFNKMQGTF